MKTRNGFVSNSSSSSFVVLLPDNFDVDSFVTEELVNSLDVDSLEDIESDDVVGEVRKIIEKFIIDSQTEYDDYRSMSIVSEVLKDYIIAEIESGPDDGLGILVETSKVKKILGI